MQASTSPLQPNSAGPADLPGPATRWAIDPAPAVRSRTSRRPPPRRRSGAAVDEVAPRTWSLRRRRG